MELFLGMACQRMIHLIRYRWVIWSYFDNPIILPPWALALLPRYQFFPLRRHLTDDIYKLPSADFGHAILGVTPSPGRWLLKDMDCGL
jgi:hypothetical protein